MGDKKIGLPPGFEFDPSDEELIVYFLCPRAATLPCTYPNIIPHLHLYPPHPWDLNDKAFRSKKEWYFFSRLKKNGCRRKAGFWKEVGVSEPIFTGNGDEVGTKKYLVFEGDEGNWIMEEYHLLSNHSTSHQMPQNDQTQDMNEWVLCRVREAKVVDSGEEKMDGEDGVELSYLDEVFFSMEDDDDQEEINFPT